MPSKYAWLMFVVMTVTAWGVYGILLHKGVMGFDPKNDPTARYKAFFFVGIAYFITAVLGPLAILIAKGSSWEFLTNGPGLGWSLVAGVAGAIGAFGVLLAFGAGGKPAVVMSIIFAGAPVINGVVAVTMDKNWGHIPWQFVFGIGMAAGGGFLVTIYKPVADHGPPPSAVIENSVESGSPSGE